MRALRLLHLAALVAGFGLTLAARVDAQSSSPASDPNADHTQQKPVEQSKPAAKPAEPHQHAAGGKPAQDLPPFIPPLNDDDRKAAFPDVEGHAVHDRALHYYVLIGRDRDRIWFRAEGDSDEGRVGEAQAHVLYGRQFSRWWDIVGGIRQDFRPGQAQTWAAIGVQGLAPYWFDIEATAYVGASGRTHARFEVEYELLVTNRLIFQPLVEAEIFGTSDPERGVGAGVSTTDVGFRLRYEFRREVAPYVGVVWSNKWGKTAAFAEAAGEQTGGARLVTGVRLWF
jgi:copper resistance protein B